MGGGGRRDLETDLVQHPRERMNADSVHGHGEDVIESGIGNSHNGYNSDLSVLISNGHRFSFRS